MPQHGYRMHAIVIYISWSCNRKHKSLNTNHNYAIFTNPQLLSSIHHKQFWSIVIQHLNLQLQIVPNHNHSPIATITNHVLSQCLFQGKFEGYLQSA